MNVQSSIALGSGHVRYVARIDRIKPPPLAGWRRRCNTRNGYPAMSAPGLDAQVGGYASLRTQPSPASAPANRGFDLANPSFKSIVGPSSRSLAPILNQR